MPSNNELTELKAQLLKAVKIIDTLQTMREERNCWPLGSEQRHAYNEVCDKLDALLGTTVRTTDPAVDKIRGAINEYYGKLFNPHNAAVAQATALSKIEDLLGMSWDQYRIEKAAP